MSIGMLFSLKTHRELFASAESGEADDRTSEATQAWPGRPPATGPGYAVNPGEAGMDGFYYACLRKHVV